MIRRTIVAALLAGLASPVLAGQFASPSYDQAANLANGKAQAGAAYDGSVARGAVAAPIAGSLRTTPQTPLSSVHPSLQTMPVPAPETETSAQLPNVRHVLYGNDGAPAENAPSNPLGAAGGALAGAALGLGIGVAMSKFLS
jgi:hypothetical protein